MKMRIAIVVASCLAASLSAGEGEEEAYRGLVCRGVEEVGGLLIGHPNFHAHLPTLFVIGENPLIGTHTMEEHVAWANDPLHSYVPDGTGALVVWAHPAKNDASGILDLSGIVGVEVLYGWEKSNKVSRDKLWDEVLRKCHDQGRKFLWGFPTDDTHSISPSRMNLSWYVARLPKVDEFALKKALREGAFYLSNGPEIQDLSVKGKAISLKLDKKYDVLWLRDGQYLEETGDDFDETLEGGGNHCLREDNSVATSSLDLGDLLGKDKGIKFVRAVVWKDRSFVALTQPWRIEADGSIVNPYPAKGTWVRGMTHNHTDAPPADKSGKKLKKYRLAYQACGQLGAFATDYSYREAPYQWLASDGVPQIESVVPAQVQQGKPSELEVKGVNFAEGCVVQLNEQVVPASISNGILKVDVPGALPAGRYDITITNPKGFRGNRPAGLVVRNGNANTAGWENFTVADGLAYPHNTCVECVGDEVWVGSVWGVSRYRNGQWKVFRDEIPGGVAYDIQPDEKGGVWVSSGYDSSTGLAYRDSDGKWSNKKVADAEGLSAPDALERWGSMALEKDGTLWIANRWRGGMAVFQDGQLKRLTIRDDGLPSENPSVVAFDASGVLWAGFTKGIFRLVDEKWQKVSLPGAFESANYAFAITAGLDGSVWVSVGYRWSRAQGGGVVRFKGNETTVFTPGNSPLPSHVVRDILVDRIGNVWFASDYGVAMLDGVGEWHAFTTLNSGLGCDVVQALAEDPEGRIWFATLEGVDCFNPY